MFYSTTELIEKIMLGEDSTIEFKREMPHRDSIADEIAAFANSEGGIILNEQIVPNTYKGTLRESLYRRFITEDAEKDEIEDLLLKRSLLVQEGQDTHASVAGVLMCHESPDDLLYNSFIQAVYYRGKDKDANYQIDAKEFKGPLDQQIIDAFKFVHKHNQVSAKKEIGRIDQPNTACAPFLRQSLTQLSIVIILRAVQKFVCLCFLIDLNFTLQVLYQIL